MSTSNQELEQHRNQLLTEKRDVEARLNNLKTELKRAKRTCAATSYRVDVEWITEQERLIRETGLEAQQLQDQIGQISREQKRRNTELGLDHFIHEVLLEQMTRDEVKEIFREAIARRTIWHKENL